MSTSSTWSVNGTRIHRSAFHQLTYATIRLHIIGVTAFEAIADPTRRSLLGRLRVQGPLTVGQLAAPMAISRQAVTKHLDVLARARLVRIHWQGRERLHRLNGRGLKDVYDWLTPYRKEWDRRLERLRAHLGEPPEIRSGGDDGQGR